MWKGVTVEEDTNGTKCKKFYHKADTTHRLDTEKRFLTQRIGNVLTQAKIRFDASENKVDVT